MTPVLVACDPGTVESACVVLTPMPGSRAAVVQAEMVASTFAGLSRFLTDVEQRFGRSAMGVVAVEWAEGGIYDRFRGAPLLKAQGVAGELSGLAQARGHAVLKTSQAAWRRAVVGKVPRRRPVAGVKLPREPVAALVAKALPLMVTGVAGLNGHLLDAAGVGLHAMWLTWKRRAA